MTTRTFLWPLGSVAFLFCCLLTACVQPHPQPLVAELSAPLTWRSLGTVSTESPLAWDPSGKRLAVNDDGLTVIDLDSGERRRLNNNPLITALAWSPDGSSIAFASSDDAQSWLRIVDLNGNLRAEILINGVCRQMFWPEQSRIIAGYIKVTTYLFGTNFQAGYVEWKDTKTSTAISLVDTTIVPSHLEKMDKDAPVFTFDLSPWGDEIIYSKLYTPPLFSPYYQLVHRHLDDSRNRIIAEQLPTAYGVRFVKQGAAVMYGDGNGRVLQKDVWNDDLVSKYRSMGRSLAVSADEQWSVIDNILYRNEIPQANLSLDVKAYFAPKGGRVALVAGKSVLLLEGLAEDLPDSLSTGVEKKIRILRNWRGKGLITPDEYRQRRLRLEKK